MINRPKVVITIYAFNSEGNKILMGKKFNENSWCPIEGKLEYGEEFNECALRLLKKSTNIFIKDTKRLNFICTYNAFDKPNKIHLVAVDYYIQLGKEEICNAKFDIFYFQKWEWFSYEDLIKTYEDLLFNTKIFLKKFNIKNFEDIKNLVSN